MLKQHFFLKQRQFVRVLDERKIRITLFPLVIAVIFKDTSKRTIVKWFQFEFCQKGN